MDYCFIFSKEIYEGWQWSERYCAQPEVMSYLQWVAGRLEVRPVFDFDTWVRSTEWSREDQRWRLVTDARW